jgi:tRNA G18 (ribose-2'-O)-methylase SpoU
MGSVFARPPARATFEELPGRTLALDGDARVALEDALSPGPGFTPLTICLGAERDGLPAAIVEAADASARIPLRPDGPQSLNVAIAAAVALHELRNRIAAHA